MDRCTECGFEIRPQARFCPRCGTRVASVPHVDVVVHNPEPDIAEPVSLPPPAIDHPIPPVTEEEVIPIPPLPEAIDQLTPPPAAETASVYNEPSPAIVPAAPFTYEPILIAIERLFRFLNKGMEKQNRQNIAEVRQNKLNQNLMVRLSTMSLNIVRQATEDYIAERGYLSGEELELAILLANHAIQSGTGSFYTDAKKYGCVLKVLREAQSAQLMPPAIMQYARAQYTEKQARRAAGTPPWTEIAQVISSYLKQQSRANNLMPEVARQWIEAYDGTGPVSETARKALLDAAHQHITQELDPLSFLKKDDRDTLLDLIHNLRFEQIGKLLSREQTALLQAFSDALSDPFFTQVLPPRRSASIVFRRVELIPRIKELMASQDEKKQRQALDLLEAANKEIINREHIPIMREWLFYVRARVDGPARSVSDWQFDISRGIASWEEIWNLAVAYRENTIVQSLQVLMPGLKSQHAPFSHLRFAVSCAVTVLLSVLRREASYPRTVVSMIETFLLTNLVKLPLPLSYITWLLLANDTSEPLDSNEQLPVINDFRDILERPITYLRPAHPAREISIEDFEKDFRGLLTMVQQIERDYVLEAHQENIKIRSKALETTIRIAHGVPRRVGIFVDYENLILSLPREMQNSSEMIAETLLEHASKYGEVISSWMCYSPANIYNEYMVANQFQKAGFKIEVPRGPTGSLSPKENQADFVLLECITTAMTQSNLDMYIIVSGDHLYFERIMRLLEQGHAVSVVSYPKKLSGRYTNLQKKIQQSHLPEDYGAFTIVALNDIFHFTPEQIKMLDAEIEERRNNKK